MKHFLAAILAIFVFMTFCIAQTTDKQRINALSIELGKTGLIYNADFDHKFATLSFGFHFGAGSNFSKYLNATTVGGGTYYLIGKQNRYLELGVDIEYLVIDETSNDQMGFAFVYPDYSIKSLYSSINVGYRVYKKNKLFRVGISPGVIKGNFVPGGYISYGKTF